MNEPSDFFFWGGLGLLFLVGAFWYYRFQVYRHRKEKRGAEKDENGKAKVCITDSVPEKVQAHKEFLEYHRNCMNKLMLDWRDKVVQLKRKGR